MSTPVERVSQRVVCSAMLMDDGLVVTGVRHFSPEMRTTLRRLYPQRPAWKDWLLGGTSKPYHLRVKAQGFVDQWGAFLTREEAWVIAEREGQIRRSIPAMPGTLYSEHLY